ncbi:MAG: hypothetical protein BGO31_08940 [Bacteroidetes bacterium 43-16]|nr:MAG: hypothetical protein BGO31_08940 [Bacteroidetes bacterium 43-16]
MLITGTHIHEWLQEPTRLKQENEQSLETLLDDYPYFTPANLLLHFAREGGNRDVAMEELYGYNPVVFHCWNERLQWELVNTTLSGTKKSWEDLNEVFLEHEKEQVAQDYFQTMGIEVTDNWPDMAREPGLDEHEKSLMVVMSFAEWLQFIQRKTRAEQEEEAEKRALKAQWQKQKMTEAIEEENEEIPAQVFEMAVNSISREDGIVSESMAVVYEKQGKFREAINIYRKLSLNNPEKSIYFADKIENLQKEI